MSKIARAVVLLGAMTLTFPAWAARTEPGVGSYSVNGGRPMSKAASVKPGDSVTAGPASETYIVYANNCRVKVESGQTVTVVTDDQCAQLSSGLGSTSGLAVGAVAVGGAAAIGLIVGNNNNKRASSP